ncbi:helix-turn-helix domain-containing protein [Cedecea lapagei]|uniref:helix-turn-helix domain-containing protein n=1 Tax=Cedecea lapagei TaxID=158823 RepID=UPI000F848C47|nr:helix-turn-helix transcriptional regulator [Cedecea lapagei]
MTGAEFGRVVGLSQQQISRYERGVNHLTLTMLIKMLIALDVSLEDFAYRLSIICGFTDAKGMLLLYAKTKVPSDEITNKTQLFG